MADMTYIKLFVDYLDAIEPLGDAERGRLFTSLLEYARTGEAPQLGGNEQPSLGVKRVLVFAEHSLTSAPFCSHFIHFAPLRL